MRIRRFGEAEKMDKKKGYVVTHTHWDREWRYPIWQNRILLVQFFEDLKYWTAMMIMHASCAMGRA